MTRKERTMSFDDFINEITLRIKYYLPEDFADSSVSVQTVHKTNDLTLHGLTVRKNSDSPAISPTVYLEDPYQQHESGKALEDVLKSLADVIVENTGNCPANISGINDLNDFKKVRNLIRIKLVNGDKNKDYLREKINTPVPNTDLVATYFIDLNKTSDNHATVMITKALFDTWNIDFTDLQEAALRNTSDFASFQNIRSVLSELCGLLPAEFDVPEEDDHIMYVLSSTDKYCGAASILCPETMDMVKDLLKTDKYRIILSSLHETLIVPYHENTEMSVTDLKNMVEEVNATQVAPCDRLSDNVYEYDYDSHTLKIAA